MKPDVSLHSGSGLETPLDLTSRRVRLWVDRGRRLFIDVEPTKDGRGLLIAGRDPISVEPRVANVIEVRLSGRE